MRGRLVTVVGVLIGLALAGCAPRPSVLVVGLDGADWDVLDPLIANGHVPALARVIEEGARAPLDCTPAWPDFSCFCPPVWVSIATGQPQSVHGIRAIRDSSAKRGAAAIWEVLTDHGGGSVLASWRNTSPPGPGTWAVLTEKGNSFAGAVNYATWSSPNRVPDVKPLGAPYGLYELLGLLPFTSTRRPAHDVFAKDRVAMEGVARLHAAIAPYEPVLGRPALTMITIHSIDKSGHVTWSSIQPAPGDPIDTDRILRQAEAWDGPVFGPRPFAFGNPVSQYLEADRWLATLLATTHFDYTVLVSDHGMTRSALPGLSGRHGPGQPDAHVGIFVVQGPGVMPGAVLDDVDVLDVAPTLAWLLGLPVAEDLPGRVLTEGFRADFVAANPIERVPSWRVAPRSQIEAATAATSAWPR